MASLAKITTIGLIITLFFGQLLRFDFNGISVPLIDIFIGILAVVNLLGRPKIKNIPLFLFLIFTWIAYFLNLNRFPFSLKPLLYLLRLNFLTSFFIFPPNFSPKIKHFLFLVLTTNILFGFIQYFFWPDLTIFSALNWDPHLYRLVSTFFDPTFTGLIYLFFLIKIFLTSPNYYLLIAIYLALALTYSRSSLAAFLLAFGFLAHRLQKPKIFFLSLIILLFTLLVLPRLPGEGTRLERTSSIKAKIENYRQGFLVFRQSPLIGHGYNNLFFVKPIQNPLSHANSGFDGSLITILTTTGIIGLSLFIGGLIIYFRQSNLLHQTLLLTLLFHSLLANSLLYPWALMLLFLL